MYKRQIKKLIHFSSVSALGKNKDKTLNSESTKWEDGPQNSNYGESKMLGEREVWRGIAEGLSAIIFNPSVVLGIGNGKTGSSVILPLMARGPKKYLEGATGFVDVIDVARLTLEALKSDIIGERYIINGHNKSFQSLMIDIATQLNVNPPIAPLSRNCLLYTSPSPRD